MEIRTCEEYVLAELRDQRETNDIYVDMMDRIRDERDEARAERDALAAKVAELTEKLARATEQASAAIVRANELQRATAPEFEPAREVRDDG